MWLLSTDTSTGLVDMSRESLRQQVATRNFIPEGIYPALNNARFSLVQQVSGANDFFGVLNDMRLVRFTVVQTVKIKGMEVVCNTAGGGSAVVRMGIYNSLDFGAPGALIVDGGTVSITTTGTKAIVLDQTLVPGAYFAAVVAQDWTVTEPRFRGLLDNIKNINVPIPPVDLGFTGSFNCVNITGVSGALPALAGAIPNTNGGRRTPDIALQISV
jgi:hypothetical protein